MAGPFGWIPPAYRSRALWAAHEESLAIALAPPGDDLGTGALLYASSGAPVPWNVTGAASQDADGRLNVQLILRAESPGPGPGPEPPPPPPPDTDRFPLWRLAQSAWGGSLQYVWQLTGSCVGAGGNNALETLMGVEVALGDLERCIPVWWPYAYGQSRLRCGMPREGEGSTGACWAAAIREDGCFAHEEAQGLPAFKQVQGWRQLTTRDEYRWSAGAWSKQEYGRLGLLHLVGQVTPIRTPDDWEREIRAGNPITLASMFGTRTIRPRGTPAVNIAEYDSQWPHQMYSDEVWRHPTLGRIFRIGNNWGPDAHPAPTQGEPAGGFYLTESTADRICREQGSEVFSYRGFSGFKRAERVAAALAALQPTT